jgi:hypothetical protein
LLQFFSHGFTSEINQVLRRVQSDFVPPFLADRAGFLAMKSGTVAGLAPEWQTNHATNLGPESGASAAYKFRMILSLFRVAALHTAKEFGLGIRPSAPETRGSAALGPRREVSSTPSKSLALASGLLLL